MGLNNVQCDMLLTALQNMEERLHDHIAKQNAALELIDKNISSLNCGKQKAFECCEGWRFFQVDEGIVLMPSGSLSVKVCAARCSCCGEWAESVYNHSDEIPPFYLRYCPHCGKEMRDGI